MNSEARPEMTRELQVGYIDGYNFPLVFSINKILTLALEALLENLKVFLTQNPGWYYGDAELETDSTQLCVWCIRNGDIYSPTGKRLPPSLEISFWKHGPTPIFKGKKLTNKELDVPAQFMARFLEDHPELQCRSRVTEPWVITYWISEKHPVKRGKKRSKHKN